MPAIVRRASDPDELWRHYWWAIGLVVIGIGGCLFMALVSGGGPSVSGFGGQPNAQSLDSLDADLKTVGTPGLPINLSMDGSDHATPGAGPALYEAPEGGGSPGAPVGAASSDATGPKDSASNLAKALQDVGKRMGKLPPKAEAAAKDDKAAKGWGGEAARTGLAASAAAPHAHFAALSGLGSSGGGGSGASVSVGGAVGATPFGTQTSNPGMENTIGAGGRQVVSNSVPGGGNPSSAQPTSRPAALDAPEGAVNSGAQMFDQAAKAPALASANGVALDAGNGTSDGVPDNLKANAPNLDQKKIDGVPPIPDTKDAGTGQALKTMLITMVVSMAVAGIAGPVMGAMSAGISRALGMPAGMGMGMGYGMGMGGMYGGYNPMMNNPIQQQMMMQQMQNAQMYSM